MRVKNIALCVLWLASSYTGNGQDKQVVMPVSQSDSNTLLWKVSGKGLSRPSYIFGTMHILCAGNAHLSQALKNVIHDCDRIYFEIDMDNMSELMGAFHYLTMSDGKKLSDLLKPDEYDRVKRYFDKHSVMPFAMMTRFKPYFVSSLIEEQLMTCEKKNGMEEMIMKESRKYHRDIRGLETAAFQASLFDSIPYEKQAKDLVNYIDSIDNYKKATDEMLQVYLKQDLKELDKLMQKSDPGMDEYMDLLLYNRNRRWVQKMPGLMAKESLLFAVGAGHLAGEKGVLQLLRKEGYTLTPIENEMAEGGMVSVERKMRR